MTSLVLLGIRSACCALSKDDTVISSSFEGPTVSQASSVTNRLDGCVEDRYKIIIPCVSPIKMLAGSNWCSLTFLEQTVSRTGDHTRV